MGRSFHPSWLPGVIALLVPMLAGAQAKTSLTKPDAEYGEGFTRVAAVRELGDGRVLVVDPNDKVVQLVDLRAGSAVKVGREGSGPGEYAFPSAVLGLPDGTSLVYDMMNRRFLTISADGKPGAFLDLPRPPASAQRGPGPQMMFGGINMWRADAKGRLYFQGSPFAGGGAADSVPILRWDRVRPNTDTVAFLKLPPSSVQTSGGQGRFEVRVGGQKVFTPAEAWAVSGDGRIARVTPSPYRVTWIEPSGRITAGPVQPYTPIRVTEADKELVREARRRTRPTMIVMGDGGRSVSNSPAVNIPEPEFEETMPPFQGGPGGPGGSGSVLATLDGEVWVLRTRPAGDKVPSYDVFDRTGTLVKKVTLNPDRRIVGFGTGTVYVVRTDEDDLQYLQRHKRP